VYLSKYEYVETKVAFKKKCKVYCACAHWTCLKFHLWILKSSNNMYVFQYTIGLPKYLFQCKVVPEIVITSPRGVPKFAKIKIIFI